MSYGFACLGVTGENWEGGERHLVWTWGKVTSGCACCLGCNLVEPRVSWYETSWQELQHTQITNWWNHKNEVAHPNTPKSKPKPNSTSLLYTLAVFFFFFNLTKAKLFNSFFLLVFSIFFFFFFTDLLVFRQKFFKNMLLLYFFPLFTKIILGNCC